MFKNIDFIENCNLSNFSTMKTGGVGKYIVFPKNVKELQEILKIIEKKQLKMLIIGNGSNILFDDTGFDGVLISLKHFDEIEKIEGNKVWIGAGINLFLLNNKLKNLCMSGMEWSFGIPATLGGLVVGNGGCFGHEIGNFVEEVVVLQNLTVKTLKKQDLMFEYRNSNLRDYAVLKVLLKLKPSSSEEVQEKMNYFLNMKRNAQPCDLPSLGSVFKLVVGKEIVYPAKLIDNLGLKGVRIGGAEVSTKHAGFIVNRGGATSHDVLNLVKFLEGKLAEIGVFPEREIVVLQKE